MLRLRHWVPSPHRAEQMDQLSHTEKVQGSGISLSTSSGLQQVATASKPSTLWLADNVSTSITLSSNGGRGQVSTIAPCGPFRQFAINCMTAGRMTMLGLKQRPPGMELHTHCSSEQ